VGNRFLTGGSRLFHGSARRISLIRSDKDRSGFPVRPELGLELSKGLSGDVAPTTPITTRFRQAPSGSVDRIAVRSSTPVSFTYDGLVTRRPINASEIAAPSRSFSAGVRVSVRWYAPRV
jgi:hypothetical protein